MRTVLYMDSFDSIHLVHLVVDNSLGPSLLYPLDRFLFQEAPLPLEVCSLEESPIEVSLYRVY